MINNLFTISSSDGKLNSEPSGNFVETSSYPTDAITLMKGTSDLTLINDGIPGFYSNESITRPNVFIEENGEPVFVTINGGKSAFLGNKSIPLQGTTIYGYIITSASKPHPYPTSSTMKQCYVLNFITDPLYKLAEPTYKGWGLTGVSWTASNKLWHGYTIEGYTSAVLSGRLDFGPIMWNYYGGRYAQIQVPFVTVINGKLTIDAFTVTSSDASYQHTENSKFAELYSPRAITVLNSDIIIPSLEDRVDKLEKQVAALPSTIDTAFALAIDKVSKLFITR